MLANQAPIPARRAPGPKGHFLLGNLPELRHRPVEQMAAWHATHGEIVRLRLGHEVLHMLSHPELAQTTLIDRAETFVKMYRPGKPHGLSLVLGQGLVTSRGELWRRQRRLIQPMFHRSSVAAMEAEILGAGTKLLEDWARLPEGSVLDIGEEMMRLTLEIITRTMFGSSVLAEFEVLGPALTTALQYAAKSAQNPFLPPLWIPTPENRRFRKAMAVLDELIYRLIGERRRSGERRGDLLDLLLEARDESGRIAMDDQLVRDEAMTIFAAGHETTAVALTWTWYLLARHPQALESLHRELDEVLSGRPPAASDLPRLIYTRAIFDEALRLYPPAVGVMRAVERDTELDGYRLPGGSTVFVNIANIHRHGDFWESPEFFRPERFLDDQRKPGHRLAYMPFGAGSRACAGNHFATMEGTLLLAQIAQRFRLEQVSDRPAEISLAVTQKPRGGLPMRPLRRVEGGTTSV
jgi:cytochrome P450